MYKAKQPLGTDVLKDVSDWAYDEFKEVEQGFLDLDRIRLATLNVEPEKKRDGDIAFADGTDWNPGSGQGTYIYYGGAWHKMQNTAVGTIIGSTGAVDNALIRADGTGGSTIQSSSATLDDSGVLTVATLSPTNALAINKGGTANTTATAAFDALAPTTTRGDIITRGASNNVSLALGASGKGLRSNGTDVVYGVEWTTVFKTADESVQNNTFQDDNHLLFAVAANTKYAWKCKIHYNTPAAADIKFQFTGPGSPTLVRTFLAGMAPDGTTWVGTVIWSAFSTAASILGAANTAGYVEFSGILQNGANAGTVTLQWAQNTTTASDTTVYAGSFLDFAIVQ